MYGTRLTVTQIYSQATGSYGCIDAWYTLYLGSRETGDIVQTRVSTVPICSIGGASGTYYYSFGPASDGLPVTLIRGGTALTFWDRVPGEPLVNVHS